MMQGAKFLLNLILFNSNMIILGCLLFIDHIYFIKSLAKKKRPSVDDPLIYISIKKNRVRSDLHELSCKYIFTGNYIYRINARNQDTNVHLNLTESI